MSTSLAEQLRRLKAPQTTLLVDSKKRASILFDPKEAALKDRETIFDIGFSGLTELTALNPSFAQFESTLFDRNARDMQRAVESREVNEHLNETIKKFLVHLSPYLLLQSSHKCLEWLIRRFNINEYNRDDLMMLIFPYHETKIFVKCVQTMRLREPNDKWNWLHKIQSPGVPLSKQAVLNRAASTADTYFLDFVCKSVVYAANELQSKPNTLQVFYAFYCTTVIGALESSEINDAQITIITGALSKGLKSNSVDFCAASLMIIGQLVSKAKLSKKWLESIIRKLLQIRHAKLQNDIVVLLVLIYRNQPTIEATVPKKCADDLVHNKWLAPILAQIYGEGINVLPFYVPLLSHCLRRVQTKWQDRRVAKTLCEQLLTECLFKGDDAAAVVRCALESYILCEDSVTILDSENEDHDVQMKDDPHSAPSIKGWYTHQMKLLERRYSSTFDAIVKELIRSPRTSMSQQRQDSLKSVLKFVMSIVCTDDNVNLFEKLYHYNAQHRIEGIKYLVKNFQEISFSDDSKGLLRNSIAERIVDDSPLVVNEALKFESGDLIRIVERKHLHPKLIDVIGRTLANQHQWEAEGLAAIKHLTSKEMIEKLFPETATSILLTILPFLLQVERFGTALSEQILNSSFAEKIAHEPYEMAFLVNCKAAVGDCKDKRVVGERIAHQFASKKGLPEPAAILRYLQSIAEDKLNVSQTFYAMLMLCHSLKASKELEKELANEILTMIDRLEKKFKTVQIDDSDKWIAHAAMGSFPLNLNIACIVAIIDSVPFKEHLRITHAKPDTSLAFKIFERFVGGMQKNKSKSAKYALYADAMEKLFGRCCNTTAARIRFLSNYFLVEFLPDEQDRVDVAVQVFAIQYLNRFLTEQKADARIDLEEFVNILSGLRSPSESVRQASFETLIVCSELKISYTPLIARLLERREEIVMDKNQLPLILHTILQQPASADLKEIFSEFIESIPSLEKFNYFHAALLLEALTHVNTPELMRASAQRANNILNIHLEAKPSTKHSQLSAYPSIVVRNFLMRFNAKTIAYVKNEPMIWDVLVKAIKSYAINLNRNGKLVSVTSVLVSVLNADMFSELHAEHQQHLIQTLVHTATFCENPDLTMSIGKFFKQIVIDAKLCVNLLDQMANCKVNVPRGKNEADYVARHVISAVELLKIVHWKCGVTWLEFLQNRNKQNTLKQHLLVQPLFTILQKCLDLEDQTSVEYTKQLVLSCILNVCVAVSPDGTSNRKLLPDTIFKVESIVKCIRGTQNPQTHHHALQLLAHMAKMLPEPVLDNMIDIFTFMGSSVVRHDDAYSFQIISKIITSIIPILVRHNEQKSDAQRTTLVVPVLKVFSVIVLDVPEHRRLPLYVQLIDTLGASDYLWMFLAVLIESQAMIHPRQSTGELPRRIEIGLAVAKEFDCETIVVTAMKMLRFVQKLPNKKIVDGQADDEDDDDEEMVKVPAEVAAIFNVNACRNDSDVRYYKYLCIQFVGNLTSSTDFVNKIAQLSDDEAKQMKSHYQNAIISVLTLIPDVSKSATADTTHAMYWKALLHHCYDILDNVISLLSPNMVLVVVEGLLSHKLPNVRRKVIELLNNKLQFKTEFFAESDEGNLIRLLDPLTNIVESIIDDSKLIQNATAAENMGIQQISLVAVKLLSKQLAQKQPTTFRNILITLIKVLDESKEVPRILLATVVLCLAELCSNLRAHSIVYLPRFMSKFLTILQKQAAAPSIAANDNVLIAMVAAILKIVTMLPLFLSPYLVDLIVSLCQIWDRVAVAHDDDKDTKSAAVVSRLNAIWDKLAGVLPLRVLLPTIDQSYKQLIADGNALGVGPLMQLLKQTIEQQNAASINSFMSEITSFFVDALQFRTINQATDIDRIEDKIVEGFVAVTMKLSEGSFRPLYWRIFEWAFRNGERNDDRAITFYKLSCELGKALKSLYVLFASDVIQNAIELLQSLNGADDDAVAANMSTKSILLGHIVGTLNQIFLHDSQRFMNASRFDALLQPLVDQIENGIVLNSEKNQQLLTTCLAQLGTAINDDIMWKQLNYQILLKTRSNEPEIRIFGLKVCVELASKLGEDYMPLLPETVPFLSEMLEDENPQVEKQCQRSVQELERVLGEPLQKYF